MGNRNEIHTSDTLNDDGEEFQNITGSTIGTKRALDVTVLGGGGAITDATGQPVNWDTITVAEPSATVETYTYSFGVTDLVVVTSTYTDSTKDTLSTVIKTAP